MKFFCQKWIQRHQKWGYRNKHFENRTKFGHFRTIFVFSLKNHVLCKVRQHLRKYKIAPKRPKTAKFGPIFKMFVSIPPFLIVLNLFLAKKISIKQFSIRKFLKIRPNFVILGQFSYIMKCSYVGLSRGRQRKIKFFN